MVVMPAAIAEAALQALEDTEDSRDVAAIRASNEPTTPHSVILAEFGYLVLKLGHRSHLYNH
ncbi:MAG: hypothetical protein DLM55_03760 [Acidimicrobiales bacterium]|nr:MAG: hypothetical protein DLM55_03760 [Acidimicrobiales bacterium]